MPALVVDAVSHAFGTHRVLERVSLTVPKGSITAVLGPSGGGKTTLLRAVAGFETPSEGTITIAGNDVVRDGRSLVPPERRGVTIVPQEGALFPHLSVFDNIAFGLKNRRGGDADKRVRHLLDLIELGDVAEARPAALSGGMQQRVALARALAPSPALVLLDEPFTALDATLRQTVRDEVVATLRREGETALWVTHDQQEALSVADQVAVLLDGQLVQVTDPVTLYREPATKQVARFVGDAVVLRGTVEATECTPCAMRVVSHCRVPRRRVQPTSSSDPNRSRLPPTPSTRTHRRAMAWFARHGSSATTASSTCDSRVDSSCRCACTRRFSPPSANAST